MNHIRLISICQVRTYLGSFFFFPAWALALSLYIDVICKDKLSIFFIPSFQPDQSSNIQSDSYYYTNGDAVLFFGDFPTDHIKIVFRLITFLAQLNIKITRRSYFGGRLPWVKALGISCHHFSVFPFFSSCHPQHV